MCVYIYIHTCTYTQVMGIIHSQQSKSAVGSSSGTGNSSSNSTALSRARCLLNSAPPELQVRARTHALSHTHSLSPSLSLSLSHYAYAHINVNASILLIPRLVSCRVPWLAYADPSNRNLPIIRPTNSALRRCPRPTFFLQGESWEDGMISKAPSTSMALRWMRYRGGKWCHLTPIQQQEHASYHHHLLYPSPRPVTPRCLLAPTLVSAPK